MLDAVLPILGWALIFAACFVLFQLLKLLLLLFGAWAGIGMIWVWVLFVLVVLGLLAVALLWE
jgi:hypothetical protein